MKMEAAQEESDILIDIPELDGLTIAPGQELKLMVRRKRERKGREREASKLRAQTPRAYTHPALLSLSLSNHPQDLDTATPRLEIGPLRFVGQYAYVIGTVVVVSPPAAASEKGKEDGGGQGASASDAAAASGNQPSQKHARIESLVRKKIVFKLAAGSLAASRAATTLGASGRG
jgi:hypothetical protein